jgi:hypothetical protein
MIPKPITRKSVFLIMKHTLILICLCAIAFTGRCQQGWVYNGNFNFGCNYTLNYSRGSTAFPGLKIFCGFCANGIYKDHFILNYGPSLSFYTKSIGANLNPLISDVQIDFVNSFSFGAGASDLPYFKFFRTLDNSSYYNVMLNKDYAALLTSNFILNNHGRNQVNGAITLSSPWATLNYYNDGGAPFYRIPIADNLDRYWTGGFAFFVHNTSNYKQSYNSVEFSFDQFTGYSPLLFEACNMLGIYIPNYNLQYDESSHGPKPTNYNTSMFDLKIFPIRGYGIDIGAMGSLKDVSTPKQKEIYYSLQDIIHIKGGFSLHPNNDNQHFFIGGVYENFNNVTFK